MRRLRFHWSLSAVGDPLRRARERFGSPGIVDPKEHAVFCREAEGYEIESVLMAFGAGRPDPFAWSAALGTATERMKFLIAIRSGISSPTYFVQQINTIGVLTGGRVCINVVAGRHSEEQRFYGDFLDHDERYARTDEFWTICHALWSGQGPVDFTGRYYHVEGARLNTPFTPPGLGLASRPEIYLGGTSDEALSLAIRHADCLLTFPDAPDRLAERVAPVLASGTDVGLSIGLIAGRTRADALARAESLISSSGEQARVVHQGNRSDLDSVGFRTTYAMADRSDWLTDTLWAGAVPYHGPASVSLVGSPDEIVDAIYDYFAVGITQFLFVGYPDDREQLTLYGEEILPRLRERGAAPGGLSTVHTGANRHYPQQL